MDMNEKYDYEFYETRELSKDVFSKPYIHPSSKELDTESALETLGIYQRVNDELQVEVFDEAIIRTADVVEIDKNKPWREIVRRKIANG